jgi:7-carboxy-7-deazaguanine synthase
MMPDAILEKVLSFGLPLVELTGGEPLLQPGVLPLMTAFCDRGLDVLLETSGSLPIESVDPRVCRIVDMKTPSSDEVAANRYENLKCLRSHDEVKFVIGDRTDYLWSRVLMETYDLSSCCTVLMGTVFGKLAEKDLAAWMVEDLVPARMQIQMHKYIWDPHRRGV